MSNGTERLKAIATGKPETSANPVAAFSAFLDRFKPQMALALPKHLNPDRMARLALTQFSSTPKLQACEPKTIIASIMNASVLGLEIGVDGQGFLVPYDKTCTFVPGWKGLCDLVTRSGRATVWTGAVFEGDEFEYQLGDNPYCRHKPGDEDDPEKLTHVYAIGKVNGSQVPVIEVWTIKKVWNHRNKYNKVGSRHYSYRDKEMYARKVALLQVLKYMPKSVEVQNAMAIAMASEQGKAASIQGDFVTVDESVEITDKSTGEVSPTNETKQSDAVDPLPTIDVETAAPVEFEEFNEAMRLAKKGEEIALDFARKLPQGMRQEVSETLKAACAQTSKGK